MSGNRPADISTVTNAIKLLLKIDGIDPKEVLQTRSACDWRRPSHRELFSFKIAVGVSLQDTADCGSKPRQLSRHYSCAQSVGIIVDSPRPVLSQSRSPFRGKRKTPSVASLSRRVGAVALAAAAAATVAAAASPVAAAASAVAAVTAVAAAAAADVAAAASAAAAMVVRMTGTLVSTS